MWFTLDGVMGELSHIESGGGLSGTEVLRIFQYFGQFLRIRHMLICDNATIRSSQSNISIPLRLITAIADEKTWIEKHIPGMRLMEGNIPVGQLVSLNQNSMSRKKALCELQKLTLSDWQKMMSADQSEKLQILFDNYFSTDGSSRQSFPKLFSRKKNESEKHCSMENVTLQMLASAVYRESKESDGITGNLIILNELLCGNIDMEFGNIAIPMTSSDFWVKSKVKQLLWGSYVWKQMADMDIVRSSKNLNITGSMKL
jgi:hypothetical protein